MRAAGDSVGPLALKPLACVPPTLPRAKQKQDKAILIRSGCNRLRSSLLKRPMLRQRKQLLNEVRSLRMCDRKLAGDFWYAMESTATCDGGVGQHDPELPPHQQGKAYLLFSLVQGWRGNL